MENTNTAENFKTFMNDTKGGDMAAMLSIKDCVKGSGLTDRTIRRYIKDERIKTEIQPGSRGNEHRINAGEFLTFLGAQSKMIEKSTKSGADRVADELQKMRNEMEANRLAIGELKAENRDLRAEVHQLHDQVLRSLPAPKKGIFRWFKK